MNRCGGCGSETAEGTFHRCVREPALPADAELSLGPERTDAYDRGAEYAAEAIAAWLSTAEWPAHADIVFTHAANVRDPGEAYSWDDCAPLTDIIADIRAGKWRR